ncbi:MAG: hypothetical protein QXT63_07450 [Thermoplasmata archaeon]
MIDGTEISACMDLGAFDPTKPDCGVKEFIQKSKRLLDWICIMEDRRPDFYLTYKGNEEIVPLNRHGPNTHTWRTQDLKRLVKFLHLYGISVQIGFWIHECQWVDERHPELLMMRSTGSLWKDNIARSADINPLKKMRKDEDYGIKEGERFYEYALSQYKKIQAEFEFDGLFIGDGGMGFREFGDDKRGLKFFDYSENWLDEFVNSKYYKAHENCAIKEAGFATVKARDIWNEHWNEWLKFNVDSWTELYRYIAKGVHEFGGKLSAYNTMNYGPIIALLHGVDYRAIAEAGLDYLIFQTYDYAWGPLKFEMVNKDISTNLFELRATKAFVDNKTKVFFTAEIGDRVEGWKCPIAHTLGEVYMYGYNNYFDGKTWRAACDGSFVVWGNHVSREEWTMLKNAFQKVVKSNHEPLGKVLVWDDEVVNKVLNSPFDVFGSDVYSPIMKVMHKAIESESYIDGIIRKEYLDKVKVDAILE